MIGLPHQSCQDLTLWIAFALVTLVASIAEFWLGRTNKTKSGSLLELLVRAAGAVIVLVLTLFWRKKNDDGTQRNEKH